MRSLTGLLTSAEGRQLLERHGMLLDREDFLAELRPPVSDAANDILGLPAGTRNVAVGQQACTDYQAPTLTKFEAAAALAADSSEAVPVLLWHDLDRIDSERRGMRIVIPAGSSDLGIPLAARADRADEARFVEVSVETLDNALERLGRWVRGVHQTRTKSERRMAQERLGRLVDAVRSSSSQTLGQLNARLSSFLLGEQLDLRAPSAMMSTMLEAGLLADRVPAYLAARDDVIAVFNEEVERLAAQDVDPLVKPLPQDHLPLHYACPAGRRRVRLHHQCDGADHYAVGSCSCGEEHRFRLGGSGALGLGELGETGRWSPDVTLPIHVNDLSSGWIVGRSTALYGMVLNTVASRVLGMRPIPGLVPPSMLGPATPPDAPSLLVGYLAP